MTSEAVRVELDRVRFDPGAFRSHLIGAFAGVASPGLGRTSRQVPGGNRVASHEVSPLRLPYAIRGPAKK